MTWRTRAEMDGTDPLLLGEDERGDLWVPAGDGTWRQRFRPLRPAHWRPWFRSWRRRRLAMIELAGPQRTLHGVRGGEAVNRLEEIRERLEDNRLGRCNRCGTAPHWQTRYCVGWEPHPDERQPQAWREEAALLAVAEAAERYVAEKQNPAPDMTMRRIEFDRLAATLAPLTEEEGDG